MCLTQKPNTPEGRLRVTIEIMLKIFALLFLFSLPAFAQAQDCDSSLETQNLILEEVKKKNPNAIKALPACFKLDRKLILKTVLLDVSQFQYADDALREDELYIKRLLKISPEVLKYAAKSITRNQSFMQYATYINRDALQYADPLLLDNKLFMRKMIDFDSRNYIYVSDRLKEETAFAAKAFKDDGKLLAFAPDKIKANKKMVEIAIKSNVSAFDFASDKLKKDKHLQHLAKSRTSIKSKEDLEEFLRKNYTEERKEKNLGMAICCKAKFFTKNKKLDHNYITKWQKLTIYDENEVRRESHLITVDSRNYQTPWQKDFKAFTGLSKRIEKFFLKHNFDKNTIDSLVTTYIWKIKDKPQTVAFNLYLLRESSDSDLGPNFADVTSITAIASKIKNEWHLSIVEVIFDSEIKVDKTYKDGHKRYILWDLYKVDKKDKNPKIIFKVEDKFSEYFEIFEEQANGKYRQVYQINPVKYE